MPLGFGLLNFLKRGSGAAWDPSSLPNLAFWLKTADLADGAVASWAPSAGTGTFAQATGANKPTKASGPKRVTFTASAPDYLTSGAGSLFSGGVSSVACNFKLNSLPSSGNFSALMELATVSSAWQISPMNLGAPYQNFSFLAGGSTAVGINITLDTSPHTIIVTCDGVDFTAPSSYTCYLDGVAQTVLTSSAFGHNGGNTIGARGTAANPFDGDLTDFIATNDVITSGNAAKLHTYLAGARS